MRPLSSVLVLAGLSLAAGCGDEEPIVAEPGGPLPDSVVAPPPLSGGTLAVTQDGTRAIAADPGIDRIFVIGVADRALEREIELQPGDEPGRVVEGEAGEMFVVLRGAGAVARVSLADGAVTRAGVCPAPRGIDYDADGERLFVACAGGELATLSRSLEILATAKLDRDLRDVVWLGDGTLAVSRFRSAEVLMVNALDGIEQLRARPADYVSPLMSRSFSPAVGYRMQPLSGGQVAIVHQRGLVDPIPTGPSPSGQSYYGGTCDQVIVHAAVTVFESGRSEPVTLPTMGGIGNVVLPVDLAVSPDGSRLAVVGAGNEMIFQTSLSAVVGGDVLASCAPFADQTPASVLGEPVAVAYDASGGLIVQTRQPAAIHFLSDAGASLAKLELPGPSRRHWGHALFHRAASPTSPIACASCHAEGREDGRNWHFQDVGLRRTQDVSGGITATKPFHWDGELADMHEFMGEVFVNRMGGVEVPVDRLASLEEWLDGLERLPASPGDPAAVARGEQLFHDSEVACGSCHAGELLTNNATVDVGTGKPFQVPSLVGLWSRAPYMHDGCAPSLEARFDTTLGCGGSELHGKTAHLTAEQLGDLIAYLESL